MTFSDEGTFGGAALGDPAFALSAALGLLAACLCACLPPTAAAATREAPARCTALALPPRLRVLALVVFLDELAEAALSTDLLLYAQRRFGWTPGQQAVFGGEVRGSLLVNSSRM